jgi:NaMN:DMB phosphoribosyltransferase
MSVSAIKLINSYPHADTAEFRVYQGNHQVARIGVHRGGEASIPTTTNYTAQATTNMGEFTLTSNTVSFEGNSITVLAQVLSEQGTMIFSW